MAAFVPLNLHLTQNTLCQPGQALPFGTLPFI